MLEELAGETEAVEFVKLDIDANPVGASRYERALDPDGDPVRRAASRAETVIGARPAAHFRRSVRARSRSR